MREFLFPGAKMRSIHDVHSVSVVHNQSVPLGRGKQFADDILFCFSCGNELIKTLQSPESRHCVNLKATWKPAHEKGYRFLVFSAILLRDAHTVFVFSRSSLLNSSSSFPGFFAGIFYGRIA